MLDSVVRGLEIQYKRCIERLTYAVQHIQQDSIRTWLRARYQPNYADILPNLFRGLLHRALYARKLLKTDCRELPSCTTLARCTASTSGVSGADKDNAGATASVCSASWLEM